MVNTSHSALVKLQNLLVLVNSSHSRISITLAPTQAPLGSGTITLAFVLLFLTSNLCQSFTKRSDLAYCVQILSSELSAG